MVDKANEIFERTKGKRIGLFVDNANWFYPQRELGWHISFSRLLKFLKQQYSVLVVNIYAGTPLIDSHQQAFGKFCHATEKAGFTMITKPLKKIWTEKDKGKFIYKANFDVEIAIDVARQIQKIDLVMIGSGDSDFLEVAQFAKEHGKGFITLCFERGVAWEMRKHYHIFLEDIKAAVLP